MDANQGEIVEELRTIEGLEVFIMSSMGDGCPDLFIVYKGYQCWLELKVEDGKLTPAQEKWWARYYAAGGRELYVARSREEAKNIVIMGWINLRRQPNDGKEKLLLQLLPPGHQGTQGQQ